MSNVLISRVRERLKATGLTPNRAAIMAGLGRDAVRDILRGESREPSAVTLAKLAPVLDCTVDYLTGAVDVPHSRTRSQPPGLAQPPESFELASMRLDSSLLLRTAKAWFELLDRRAKRGRRELTPEQRADGLVTIYLGLLGQGQVDDSSIREKIDLFE